MTYVIFIILANYSAVPVPGVNIEEHLQLRQEEKRQRVIRRHRLEDGRGKITTEKKYRETCIL